MRSRGRAQLRCLEAFDEPDVAWVYDLTLTLIHAPAHLPLFRVSCILLQAHRLFRGVVCAS